MRNSTNIFLVNLSVADLFVLLICTPTVLVEVNSGPQVWPLGEHMCEYNFFFLNPRYIFTFTILLSSSHHSHNEERRDEGALTSMICRSTIPKISNAAHFLPEAVIVTLELGKTICRYSQLKESQKCKEEQSIVRKT